MISVTKNQLEQLKYLYKALLKIAEIKNDRALFWEYATQSLQYASQTLGSVKTDTPDVCETFKKINEYSYNWLTTNHSKYQVKNFGQVFEQYLKN